MPQVRVKDKYQVTIPTSLREAININEGDTLEASIENGRIIFMPQIKNKDRFYKKSENDTLMSMIGANKKSGLYKSSQEIDDTISSMREQWN